MSPPPGPGATSIHAARLVPGPSGAVLKGAGLTEVEAIAERRAGRDVVVCGDDLAANRDLAGRIEAAVGPCCRQAPHARAGPDALPHFQPEPRPPGGHCFYEAGKRRKARKLP